MLSPLFLLSLIPISLASAVPNIAERELQRRTLADVVNGLANGISVSDITQGILPDFFDNLPRADQIANKFNINNAAYDQAPVEVLNMPGYANWTSNGWNWRMHAWAYKQPMSINNQSIVSQAVLDRAANVFLAKFDINQLQPHEQQNARNLTSAVLAIPQSDVQLDFLLTLQTPQQNLSSWTAQVVWPTRTDARGEVDGFVQLPLVPRGGEQPWIPDGSQTHQITRLDVHTSVSNSGNSSAYLIPPEGVIILSDIDDILRVTKIYNPQEGLLNTFARDFVPWENMPELFADWKGQHPEQPYHFHYLSTTPEQATRAYIDFIYSNYPLGSFDTRPLNFTTVEQTFSVRKLLVEKILQTFPNRRFVLIGDTTNSDVMQEYPAAAKAYKNVMCILLRNVSQTDSTNRFPYDTSGFRGLDQAMYMFFRTPNDLKGLNFGNGDCRNASVRDTVTFGWQNLPGGINTSKGGSTSGAPNRRVGLSGVLVVMGAVGWWLM
ncbi:hypothetical protein FPQ18DRAFT_334846 [Pyronema domesticum]|uniref:Similar to Actin patch protein 1 acc. no. P53933 n=1 Tax=Pyronema omphalodes (strain CBS 100304) TaxID=1076935 RepID=U4LH97_PYROM|nr:hypothetical protein FPQ18DRAFT_334846 [Pyronema domesticum]CCX30892.1 Similar to Actin patch protein 1; acc. no. P53933 [Pyronema omphalodes CBS 100304]